MLEVFEKIKLSHEIVNATRFVVELPPRPEYDEQWLIISNNVREHDELLTCYNVPDSNNVVVVCREEAAEVCKEWLENRGEIRSVLAVPCLIPLYDSTELTDEEFEAVINLEFAPVSEV